MGILCPVILPATGVVTPRNTPLVFCEPLFTWGVVRLLNRVDAKSFVRRVTAINQLSVA